MEFFGESTVRSETDERDIDMIGRTLHQLATQIVEKIQNVLGERPITNMRGSTMVQEVHSAEDQDFKDYIEEYRKLIRW